MTVAARAPRAKKEQKVMTEDQKKDLLTVRLMIPNISATILLAEPWEMTLYKEGRNSKMWNQIVHDDKTSYWERSADKVTQDLKDQNVSFSDDEGMLAVPVTFPAETLLSVSRIYIRCGKSHYDSITFNCKKCPDTRLKGRFWAKLRDVNKIMFYPNSQDAAKFGKSYAFFEATSRVGGLGKRLLDLD